MVHSSATSSRRRPGARRRCPRRRPTSSGCSAARRVRRKAPRDERSNVWSSRAGSERGALSLLYAATQDVPGNSYIGPDGPGGFRGSPTVRRPGRAGLDPAMAGRPRAWLWDATAELVGPLRQ
ncbi:hypothetical protein ACWDWU_42935 [Streptomyces sp. NPDC003442]